MKTLVVLSALACVAIAAPALHENEWTKDSPKGNHPIVDTEITVPEMSARTHFGLKKSRPIIVKKKTGYHLYRDSAEERANAEPHENCSKHLRLKLCDSNAAAKSSDIISTNIEDIDDHNGDVGDSIKIAKEAVESLQHDLNNIEDGLHAKNAQWKHGESDKDLHEDIGIATQALDHAQRSFGNLESMSLRATTLKDTDVLHKNMELTNSEEERYAQWKEAMKNIERNIEIVTNIENSFRSKSEAEAIDTSKFMRTNEHEHKRDIQKLSAKEATAMLASNTETETTNTMEKKSAHHMTSGKETNESIAHDMKSAASEIKELKHEQEKHQETQGKFAEGATNIKTQGLDLKHDENMDTIKKVSIDLDSLLRASNPGVKVPPHATPMSLKMGQVESDHKEESSVRTSENTHLTAHKDQSSQMSMTHTSHSTKTELDSMKSKSVAKDWEADKLSKNEKTAWAEAENKEMFMKAAEHKNLALNTDLKEEKAQNSHAIWDTKTTMKAAEHLSEHKKQHKEDVTILHSDMKLADNTELTPLTLDLHQGANDIALSTLEKSAGAMHMDHLERHAHELPHAHTHAHSHAHAHHGQIHGHEMEHMHRMGMHGLSQPMHKHELMGSHGHMMIKDHHMGGFHGKSADEDSIMHPSIQTSIREFAEKSALEQNMLQWKHHDLARSYGAGLGSGGGLGLSSGGSGSAVGVFPNAKVGGCAIPLLLSCSPSVVSGSLKSQGYAAPSYRHGEDFKFKNKVEDFKFKNKRDIIKATDFSGSKIKHTIKTTQTKNLEKKL